MRAWKQTWKIGIISGLLALAMPAIVMAAQSSSSNFQVEEVFFGSGGELNSCSASFCTKQSAGELVTGTSISPNYNALGGFNTNREPYIEFTVSETDVDLGTLSPTTTKTANATFSVKAYLAEGYVVANASVPPQNGTYTMKALMIPTASVVGTEQFGINLVANTIPVSFGANPTQSPDSTFGFGQVSADYSSPNLFKYAQGDVIAQSYESSSFTNYTISYLFNVSNVTPGGSYLLQHDLVATATF